MVTHLLLIDRHRLISRSTDLTSTDESASGSSQAPERTARKVRPLAVRRLSGRLPGSLRLRWSELSMAQQGRDMLTDLPDRAIFHDRLTHALSLTRRYAWTGALLLIQVTETPSPTSLPGATIAVVQEVAHRLLSRVRESDTVARLEGSTFAVLLAGLRGSDDATVVACKILKTLGQPLAIEGRPLLLKTYIGISLYPTDGNDPRTILQNGSLALRHVRHEGRSGYQFFKNLNVF